jgi:hypothetical protein
MITSSQDGREDSGGKWEMSFSGMQRELHAEPSTEGDKDGELYFRRKQAAFNDLRVKESMKTKTGPPSEGTRKRNTDSTTC